MKLDEKRINPEHGDGIEIMQKMVSGIIRVVD